MGAHYETRPPCQIVCPACGNPRCPGARRPVRRPRRRPSRRAAGLAGAAGVLAGYGLLAAGPTLAVPGGADCAALAAQLRQLSGDRVDRLLQWHHGDGASGSEMLSGLSLSGAGSGPPPDPPLPEQLHDAVGSGLTGTNVQERDVDEPDIAKVDGTRVLRLSGRRADPWASRAPTAFHDWGLTIVEAATGRPRVLGTFLPGTRQSAHEMFVLDGHRVLVIGSVRERSPRPGDPDRTAKVLLTLLDTADAAEPKVLRVQKLTGRYVSARLVDGVVRVVVSTPPPLTVSAPLPLEPRALTKARNKAALRAYGGEDWLPVRETLDGSGRLVDSRPAMGCADVHRPARPDEPDLLTVVTVDSRDGAAALDTSTAAGLVGGGDFVYASADRLYVAQNDRGWGGPGPSGTDLHGFDTTGRRSAVHVASGRLRGRLLDSSALSWHDGHLRVAVAGGGLGNRVAVLRETADKRLRVVGRVGRIGVGETIRSVRWFGDLATLVTFRQIDPFYVVDLSRPDDPRVLGELKIPGYSGYLHPVGDGRVLGVGPRGAADGRQMLRGAQASIFDVTDPLRPVRLHELALGPGRAAAEDDPRAFTYVPGHRLAAVVGSWGPPRDRAGGIVGVRVRPDGRLREVGRHLPRESVTRVLPVAGRLAVVTATSLAILDPEGLRLLGKVDLP